MVMKRGVRVPLDQPGFELGTTWLLNGDTVQIDGIESAGVICVRIQSTGEVRRVSVASLLPLPSSTRGQDAQSITSEEWTRLLGIAQDIRPLVHKGRVPYRVLAKVAAKHGIGIRHVQRLLARFRLNPRVSTLAKRKAGRPASTHYLRPDVEGVINHVIRKYYLKRERVSQLEVHYRVRCICRRCGLPAPARSSVRRRIAQYSNYEGEMRRLGAKRARQRWEPRPGQLLVEHPLDVVQIDHTRVDLIVLSNDRREVLGRPWLTVAIDVATRVVLGFYLSMDPPSAISVGLCIAHAVLPKAEDALDPGVWPMFGKMRVIHVDNGKDLVSEAIRRGCEEHGISLETRPLGKAHYGGHVERLIGSLMKLVHGLPGTTFSNVQERGDYDSERKATLTFMELHEWLVHRIGRGYHARVHRALGVPPAIAWERAWRSPAGESILPPSVPRSGEFLLDFLPFQRRRLQRTGVQLWQSRYWSDSLACFVHPKSEVKVHYHPYDLRRVWVRVSQDQIFEAAAVSGPAAGQPRMKEMDATERSRIENEQDLGFVACDRINNMAASVTRAERRREGRAAAMQDRRLPRGVTSTQSCGEDDASVGISLDRSSVHVWRFVP